MTKFRTELKINPLVAILRGVNSAQASQIAEVLVSNGIRIIEVPLNRDGALMAIAKIKETHGASAVVGAGTVTTLEQLKDAVAAGVDFCLAPNLNEEVVRAAAKRETEFIPGVFTPSEAFRAIGLGSKSLKIFPFNQFGYASLGALRQVLPEDVALIGVGGLAVRDLADAIAKGLDGIGVGSSLYKPGMTPFQLSTHLEKELRAV